MPRLTNTTYLSIHHQLAQHYEQHNFRYLSTHDQLALHRYFLPSKNLSDRDLIAHRRSVTSQEPSLPNQAGKAWARLQRILSGERPPTRHVTPQRRPHVGRRQERRLVVTSVLRPEPDVDLFARAIVKLAMNDVDRDIVERRHYDDAA